MAEPRFTGARAYPLIPNHILPVLIKSPIEFKLYELAETARRELKESRPESWMVPDTIDTEVTKPSTDVT